MLTALLNLGREKPSEPAPSPPEVRAETPAVVAASSSQMKAEELTYVNEIAKGLNEEWEKAEAERLHKESEQEEAKKREIQEALDKAADMAKQKKAVFDKRKSKTYFMMCQHIHACKFGMDCHFAHTVEELQASQDRMAQAVSSTWGSDGSGSWDSTDWSAACGKGGKTDSPAAWGKGDYNAGWPVHGGKGDLSDGWSAGGKGSYGAAWGADGKGSYGPAWGADGGKGGWSDWSGDWGKGTGFGKGGGASNWYSPY